MKRRVAWLCGRGVARSCGFSWEVPPVLHRALKRKAVTRPEAAARIREELRRAQQERYAARGIDHQCLDRLAELAKSESARWCHVFVTTNWDTVLDRALAPHGHQVWHLNGSIDERPEALLLTEADEHCGPALERHPGFRVLAEVELVVLAGLSLRSLVDRQLVERLAAARREQAPAGDWVAVNERRPDLEEAIRLLREQLPGARLHPVLAPFERWIAQGAPGLHGPPRLTAPTGGLRARRRNGRARA